ncbi:extensin family protein [Serinicoccus kebangsaanensis]|uniref:extensin family protein n=1 Tax=Serinicoccus kebangsaanensis TaxID=2602069 RepID=UPI00124C589B|nr:extensin family protein [Serinicoccus kebangsaanensis]
MGHHQHAPSRRTLLGAAGLAGAGLLTPTGAALADEHRAALPDEHVPTRRQAQALALMSFSRINGVEVYYGTQTSPLRTWRCTPGFYDRLQAWMTTLSNWSGQAGHGAVRSIGSAGFYVNRSGQHGAGTAMDLSMVRWAGGRNSNMFNGDHASGNRTRRRRYFAVEATLRRHFRYVLDGNYNADHRNHFHADVAALPDRRLLHGSRADTVFVQAVCNNFLGSGIAIDGDWGPNTQREVTRLKNRLNVSGDLQSNRSAVNKLLKGIALHGFRDRAI